MYPQYHDPHGFWLYITNSDIIIGLLVIILIAVLTGRNK